MSSLPDTVPKLATVPDQEFDKHFLGDRRRLLLLVFAVAGTLAVVRYLPSTGVGVWLKLIAGGYGVLLLPGALVLQALGWRSSLPLRVAASLLWTLPCVFVALLLTFLFNGSLLLTIALLGAISLGALCVALSRPQRHQEQVDRAEELQRADHLAQVGVFVFGVLCGIGVALSVPAVMGDGLEHLSRARKLAEFTVLESPAVVDQYRGGGLDPGYAFPLWHGVLALIARITRLDVATVIRFLPPVLCPLSLLLLYAAGVRLFNSWVGGVCTAVVEIARLGFAFSAEKRLTGTGWFVYTSWPGQGSILLIIPALLALILTYVQFGSGKLLVGVAVGAFVLTVVHASYAPFVGILLFGFLVAHVWLRREDRMGSKRIAVSLATVLLSSALFFAWLFPVIKTSRFFQPGQAHKSETLAHYKNQVDVYSDTSFRLAPDFVVSGSGGAVSAAALFAIPMALACARRRWAAYVLGGSLTILVIVLTPPLFAPFSDFATVSQGRRLVAFFLPWSFAVVGGVLFLSRFKIAGIAATAAAGVVLRIVYPTTWTIGSVPRGPGWPVWVAVVGGVAALVAGRFLRRGEGRVQPWWPLAISLALVTPTAIYGFADLQHRIDRRAVTAGLVQAVQRNVNEREVIFSTLHASYRIQAYAPVYVAAVLEGHARATAVNRHRKRVHDVTRFFSRTTSNEVRRRLLTKYQATWIIVVKVYCTSIDCRAEWYPDDFFRPLTPVYEDSMYALYRWSPRRVTSRDSLAAQSTVAPD